MENFRKQCLIGKAEFNVWVTIEFKDGRLSITGVEGPLRNGNARGSCGQIRSSIDPLAFTKFFPGWNAAQVARLIDIWNRWHLNDMQAGSPDQMVILRAMKELDKPTGDYYNWACDTLKKAGVYEDSNHLIDGKPYRYGTKWLRVPVPNDVLQWLNDLPAEEGHPWGPRG